METTNIKAEVRTSRGKGPARRLRATGKIPGVIYGQGLEPTPLTLEPKPLKKGLLGKYRRNAVFMVGVDGTEHKAMVKDIAIEPVTREPLHVDFFKISDDTVVEVVVPFRPTGKPVGVTEGGKLLLRRNDVALRCKADDIPVEISHDISHLRMHDSLSVDELEIPEGVEILLPERETLLMVGDARVLVAEEEEAAAAEESDGAEEDSESAGDEEASDEE